MPTTTTASITPKAVTATVVAADKVYDGTTAASTSGSVVGLIAGDSVSLTTSGSFADKNAGSAKTVDVSTALSGTDAANYALAAGTTTTASITPARLTLTANNDSRTAGGSAYSGGNGVSASGFVAGDSLADLVGSLTYGGTAQGATAAGSYGIAASGLSSGNYSIRYVDGVLTLTGGTTANVVTPTIGTAAPITIGTGTSTTTIVTTGTSDGVISSIGGSESLSSVLFALTGESGAGIGAVPAPGPAAVWGTNGAGSGTLLFDAVGSSGTGLVSGSGLTGNYTCKVTFIQLGSNGSLSLCL